MGRHVMEDRQKNNAFEYVMNTRRQVSNTLLGMMNQGKFLDQREWSGIAFAPINPFNGIPFKSGNRLRLMVAAIEKGYTDPRWGTFEQYKEKGYQIRKGEHGTLCEVWKFSKETEKTDPATGKKKTVKEPIEKPQVSYIRVFNASQVNGFPEYEKKEDPVRKKEARQMLERLAKVCRQIGEMVEKDSSINVGDKSGLSLMIRTAPYGSVTEYSNSLLMTMAHGTGLMVKKKYTASVNAQKEAVEKSFAESLGRLFAASDFDLPYTECEAERKEGLLSFAKMTAEDQNAVFRAASIAQTIVNGIEYQYRKQWRDFREPLAEVPDNNTEPAKREPIPDLVSNNGILSYSFDSPFGHSEDDIMSPPGCEEMFLKKYDEVKQFILPKRCTEEELKKYSNALIVGGNTIFKAYFPDGVTNNTGFTNRTAILASDISDFMKHSDGSKVTTDEIIQQAGKNMEHLLEYCSIGAEDKIGISNKAINLMERVKDTSDPKLPFVGVYIHQRMGNIVENSLGFPQKMQSLHKLFPEGCIVSFASDREAVAASINQVDICQVEKMGKCVYVDPKTKTVMGKDLKEVYAHANEVRTIQQPVK